MKQLKKYKDSNLSSSNMINARRDEVEKLEKQRLEVNRKLERLMKKYAQATGDRSASYRRYTMGYSPNDWKPTINPNGSRRILKTWQKVLIILSVIAICLFIAHSVITIYDLDVLGFLREIAQKLFRPA